MTCLFHSRCHGTLVPGAGAGLAARADLAIFGDVLPKQVCLFVVDHQRLICTELTKFWFRKEAAVTASFRGTEWSSIFSHMVLQFSCCTCLWEWYPIPQV
jgi:hypothetical protein